MSNATLIERLKYASGWSSRAVPHVELSARSLLYWDAIDDIERLTERNSTLETAHQQMNASLDRAHAEIERLRGQLHHVEMSRDAAGKIIKRLRAALEFYADPARWMKVNNVTDERIPDFYDETNFGERALLALNQQSTNMEK